MYLPIIVDKSILVTLFIIVPRNQGFNFMYPIQSSPIRLRSYDHVFFNIIRVLIVTTLMGFIAGCSTTLTWEKEYEKISTPILEGYLEVTKALTSNVYDYEHQTIAEDQTMAGMAAQSNEQKMQAQPHQKPKLAEIPLNFQPWWQVVIVKQMNSTSTPVYETLDSLVVRSLRNSWQMKVFSDLPLIRRTVIEETKGNFDFHVFARSKYELTDEPTGDDLKTGGPLRFEQHDWTFEAGINKKLKTGGEFELGQMVERLDNNSRYLNPHDQGIARLALTFKHPLLARAGYHYNTSQLAVAQVDYKVALDEFIRQTSAHILEIERAYWGLYMERANLAQKKRLVAMAEEVNQELAARAQIDVTSSQLLHAKAVLAARYADSIRSEQAVRNAEGKLVSLINDNELQISDNLEIATIDPPIVFENYTKVSEAAVSALYHRPEIRQAFRQLKAGLIRLKMGEKERLPVLDLVVEASLKGLREEYKLGEAMNEQYEPMKPSWAVGLFFDYPLGNRTGKARLTRRQIEVRQLARQLQTTIETVLLEVQVAVREINTSYREMQAKYTAMLAARKRLQAANERRDLIFSSGQLQSIYLEQLLADQLAVSEAEQTFLTTHVSYNIAHANLDRARGILMQVKEFRPCQDQDQDDLPTLFLVEKDFPEQCHEVQWEPPFTQEFIDKMEKELHIK